MSIFAKKDLYIPDKITNFRVWKHQQNMAYENIVGRATKNQNKIKSWSDVLNEDQKNNKIINLKSFLSTSKTESKDESVNVLSPNAQRILNEVDKMVSGIKESEKNLSIININSMLNTQKKIKKTEKLIDIAPMVKIKEKEYHASLEGKTKKLPKYKYLSDNYRRQLNRAFSNFNPVKHLGKINSLLKLDPEANKEFEEQKKKVDKDIFNITNPNFYRNQYKKVHKMFQEQNKQDNLFLNNIDINLEKKNSKTISLPKVAYRTTLGFHKGNKYFATECSDKNQLKLNDRFNILYQIGKKNKKKKKSPIKRKFPDKEKRKIELELMEDACKRMMNTINYIEDEGNNFYYKYSTLNNEERKKEHNFILKDNLNTKKILLNIQNNNILRGISDLMESKTKKVSEDIKDYRKQINNIKEEIIQNIEEQELSENNYDLII